MSDEAPPNCPDDPNARPHPNPDRYETCAVCGYAYKLVGASCPHPEPAPAE